MEMLSTQITKSRIRPGAILGTRPILRTTLAGFLLEIVMGKRIEVKKGDRYGRLVIIKELPQAIYRVRFFQCLCDCGNLHKARLVCLRTGQTKSCGCYRKLVTSKLTKTHGMSGTRIFRVWCAMKERCMNPKSRGYLYYGIRGISIYKEWLEFSNFYEWAITHGYAEGLTIERENNDGNYEPNNCKWITQAEQTKNSRHCHYVTHNGKTSTVTDCLKSRSISKTTFYRRLRQGMTAGMALTKPVRSYIS